MRAQQATRQQAKEFATKIAGVVLDVSALQNFPVSSELSGSAISDVINNMLGYSKISHLGC